MKTINFELSKRLNDLGLLDNIETEYYYYNQEGSSDSDFRIEKTIKIIYGETNHKTSRILKSYNKGLGDIKVLTLEEAIEFITKNNIRFYLDIKESLVIVNHIYYEKNEIKTTCIINIEGKTLLEAIEKMIEYLLNNNLLQKG